MPPKNDRRAARATTLSISLTPELAAEVASRVGSGLYSSASELFREALRLLLRTQGSAAQPGAGEDDSVSLSISRFAQAGTLMDLGLELQAEKIRRSGADLSPAEVRQRLDELAGEQEAGPGLRVSPERLRDLKIDGQG